MSYQKPVTPQRFDKPVYERLNPKKKVEKKRATGKQRQQQKGAIPAKRRKLANVGARPRASAKTKSRSL